MQPSTASSAVIAQGGDSDIFDPAEAMRRACDDLDLLKELAELFTEYRNELLAELTEAVADRNSKGIAEAAHALKGSVGTFSTKRPFVLARDLEFCGKECRLEAAPLLLDALTASLIELEAAVKSFLSSAIPEVPAHAPVVKDVP